jgi:Na+/melibiose symporter-like transporter
MTRLADAGHQRPQRITKTILAAYAAPALALAALNIPFFVFVPPFYATERGLSLSAIGTVLLLVRVADAIFDPIVGWAGDRTTSRFGRRRPWLIVFLFPSLIALWRVFDPPANIDVIYLAIWSLALSLSWTAMILPYAAWGAELSGDYTERTRIVAWREIALLVGTLIATALPALVPDLALKALMIFAIVTMPLFIFIAVSLVPEGQSLTVRRIDWIQGLVALKANRPFVRLILAFLVNGIANSLPATLIVLFVERRLEAPGLQGAVLFVYFAAGVFGVPIWLWLANHLSKHRAWSIAMIWSGSIFSLTAFLGPGDITWMFIISALTGLGLGGELSLPPSMQADVVDLDTDQTGEQRTGLYFAAWGFATKLSSALAVGLAYPLLDLAGYNVHEAGSQTGVWMLVGLYAFAPVVIKALALMLIWNYPVDRHLQSEARKRAEQRAGLLG